MNQFSAVSSQFSVVSSQLERVLRRLVYGNGLNKKCTATRIGVAEHRAFIGAGGVVQTLNAAAARMPGLFRAESDRGLLTTWSRNCPGYSKRSLTRLGRKRALLRH